jgi:hypothetical protein
MRAELIDSGVDGGRCLFAFAFRIVVVVAKRPIGFLDATVEVIGSPSRSIHGAAPVAAEASSPDRGDVPLRGRPARTRRLMGLPHWRYQGPEQRFPEPAKPIDRVQHAWVLVVSMATLLLRISNSTPLSYQFAEIMKPLRLTSERLRVRQTTRTSLPSAMSPATTTISRRRQRARSPCSVRSAPQQSSGSMKSNEDSQPTPTRVSADPRALQTVLRASFRLGVFRSGCGKR